MVSIGKYLAYVLALAIVLFIPVAIFIPNYLDKFTNFVTTIIGIVGAAVVIYIIIKIKK
jgi:hypothetical protein